ncbi:hypothetical protein AQZ52_10845 [Novosphingobium fuchskuhlense]|uniref:Lipoprotein n=1 Tax=Novosphingobium fuchskuhlense TaxID=1117702 RepID=A0A117UUM1_9SPHN|nr:hypothetical protein [Novosphingobium fuchskuhlense]KUR71161.1 hypothetical protein AQZ52_10845 [Novosphingobium fuchskuhlense]
MRRLILAPLSMTAFTLAGCAHSTPPAIEVRTERVEVPVPVPCIKASDVPGVPPRVGDKLTGNAVSDADLLAADALRLSSALDQAMALISGCVEK